MAEPLSPEEEAEVRNGRPDGPGLDDLSPNPPGMGFLLARLESWSWLVARLLATIDRDRKQLTALERALREIIAVAHGPEGWEFAQIDVLASAALLATTPAPPEPRSLTREEAVEKALLFTFQLSNKDYRKMRAALSEVAFIRALEQDGYTVAPAPPEPGLREAATAVVEHFRHPQMRLPGDASCRCPYTAGLAGARGAWSESCSVHGPLARLTAALRAADPLEGRTDE